MTDANLNQVSVPATIQEEILKQGMRAKLKRSNTNLTSDDYAPFGSDQPETRKEEDSHSISRKPRENDLGVYSQNGKTSLIRDLVDRS